MSEQRKITVEKDNPIWQEYDREVRIELWHNRNQVTPMRLSPAEAMTLLTKLQAFLKDTK
jgi:hypothetical protein